MTPATLFGGARDGFELTLMDSIPEVLVFPEVTGALKLEPVDPMHFSFVGIRYRLRSKPRCCGTWCTWPRPCTCCPRCSTARLIYDLERE